jgi:hypothetical protein
MIECTLLCSSNARHLQQIYAGFNILHRKQVASVRYVIDRKLLADRSVPDHVRKSRQSILLARVNDRSVAYDTMDGKNIDEQVLAEVDFYFKRSFSAEAVKDYPHGARIYPLGLNYLVYNDDFHPSGFKRLVLEKGLVEKINHLMTICHADRVCRSNAFYRPRLESCQDFPRVTQQPKILFMARTWDPRTSTRKEKVDELHAINEMRARCIASLRAEFKEHFFGGFHHDDYSRRFYRDYLVTDRRQTEKSKYMETLRRFPICVATTGLHGSIGWKFAEYLAFAKSIISEPLNYAGTGDLQAGRNYLLFTTPLECVEAAHRLFCNDALRTEMMMNNFHYYQTALRPDVLVFKSLQAALC